MKKTEIVQRQKSVRRPHFGLANIFCRAILALALSVFALASCRAGSQKTEITVLAAASLTDVCGQIKAAYEKENPSVRVLFSFGGSGALQAQIEAGAPCDLFISAAQKQMKALLGQGLVEEESVFDLLKNEVVLIVPKSAGEDGTTGQNAAPAVSSFYDLSSPDVKMVAVGEVQSVPVGQYAKAVCESLGIWEAVRDKANFASDVRTVLSWVEEDACDAGIVYATDAAASGKVRVVASAPNGSCPPVVYPVGIIRASEKKSAAKAFEDFLFSSAAKKIFEGAGFVPLKGGR